MIVGDLSFCAIRTRLTNFCNLCIYCLQFAPMNDAQIHWILGFLIAISTDYLDK